MTVDQGAGIPRWQGRALANLSIGGGAIGVVIALPHMLDQTGVLSWLLSGLFIVIFGTGAWWGVRLLEGAEDALQWLFCFWVLQVPVFVTPLAGYSLASGLHLAGFVEIPSLDVGWSTRIGSQFTYSVFEWQQPWRFGVNVFAFGVSWWIWRRVEPAASSHDAPPPVADA